MSLSADLTVTVTATGLVPGHKYRLQEDYDDVDLDDDPDFFLGMSGVVANSQGVVRFPTFLLSDYNNEAIDQHGTYNFKVVNDTDVATAPAVLDKNAVACKTSFTIN